MAGAMRVRGWFLGGAVLLLATPALGGTVYSWRTEEGGVAFTDDEDNVPPRYADRVETRASGTLAGYARYTGEDPGAIARYEERLAARLAHLRALNAARERGALPARAAEVRQTVSLRTGGEYAPSLELDAAGEGPVVMEWVRMKPEGQIATRHNLVVRQGDRTLAVVKGRMHYEVGAPNNMVDEEDFDDSLR